jgi:hypothetical protein
MDDSKMENKPFVGVASIGTSVGLSWKFRVAKIVSIFTVEAPTIAGTLEIIEKTDSEQNPGSESVLRAKALYILYMCITCDM